MQEEPWEGCEGGRYGFVPAHAFLTPAPFRSRQSPAHRGPTRSDPGLTAVKS